MDDIPFCDGHIKHCEEWKYKYLGIPITKTGICVSSYLKKLKRKFYASLNRMKPYCDTYSLSSWYRSPHI